MAKTAKQVFRVTLVRETLELRAALAPKARLVLMDYKFKALREKDSKAPTARLALRALRAHVVFKAFKVLEVCRVTQAQLVCRARTVT